MEDAYSQNIKKKRETQDLRHTVTNNYIYQCPRNTWAGEVFFSKAMSSER
jgi:hypothetical protein